MRRMILGRVSVVAIIVTATAALAIPASAYSSWHSTTVPLAVNHGGTASSGCPAGQHVDMGGIGAPLSLPLYSGAAVFPQAMFMDSSQTKWVVAGINGGTANSTLTSRSYCSVHTVRGVVSKTVSVAANHTATATATCGAGKVVLGMGFKIPTAFLLNAPSPPRAFITKLRATATTVSARATALASSSIMAIAYCGPGPAATEKLVSVSVPSYRLTSVTATCPAGKHILFGGLDVVYVDDRTRGRTVLDVVLREQQVDGHGVQPVTARPGPGVRVLSLSKTKCSTRGVITANGIAGVPSTSKESAMRRTTLGRVGFVTTIVAATAALVIPASAYSSWHSTRVPLAQIHGGTASSGCPVGQHVDMGGIDAPIFFPLYQGAWVWPQAMFMDSTQTKWVVAGVNGGTANSTLTSRSYCSVHAARGVVSKTVSFSNITSTATATATCHAGKVVLGMGFKIPTALILNGPSYPRAVITKLRATSTTVTARAAGDSSSITAIAYCGRGHAAKEKTVSASLRLANRLTSATATCAAGTHIVFGGFETDFEIERGGAQVAPSSMSSSGNNKWTVSAFNASPTPGPVRSYAYCR